LRPILQIGIWFMNSDLLNANVEAISSICVPTMTRGAQSESALPALRPGLSATARSFTLIRSLKSGSASNAAPIWLMSELDFRCTKMEKYVGSILANDAYPVESWVVPLSGRSHMNLQSNLSIKSESKPVGATSPDSRTWDTTIPVARKRRQPHCRWLQVISIVRRIIEFMKIIPFATPEFHVSMASPHPINMRTPPPPPCGKLILALLFPATHTTSALCSFCPVTNWQLKTLDFTCFLA